MGNQQLEEIALDRAFFEFPTFFKANLRLFVFSSDINDVYFVSKVYL